MFFDPEKLLSNYQIKTLPDPEFLKHMESFGEQNCLKILSFIFDCLNIPNLKSIRLTRLQQGPGHSINIRIDLFDQSFVLRILLPSINYGQRLLEADFLKNASLAGIAPHVYRIDQSASFHLILMDYISTPTLGDKPTSLSNILSPIAKSIRKISQLPGEMHNSSPIRTELERDLDLMKMQDLLTSEISECLPFLQTIFDSLENQPISLIPSHGDLNPYNIFFDKKRVLFIDWSFAGWRENFFDLGYFSATFFLDEESEKILLETYLERTPSMLERAIFYLMKQLARFRLGTRLQVYCNFHFDQKIERIKGEAFHQFKLHAKSNEMVQFHSILKNFK